MTNLQNKCVGYGFYQNATVFCKTMKFLYGTNFYYVDVTDKVAAHCVVDGMVVLPETDIARAQLFGDPLVGKLKHMKIIDENGTDTIVAAGTPWSRLFASVSFDYTPYVTKSPSNYKYRLAVACMFKDSAFYLKEWMAFHIAVGVEHFYLCDNNSTDDYMSLLKPYIDQGLITLTKTSGVSSRLWEFERDIHMPFYNRIIEETRSSVEWLACIDSDEFIVPPQHDTILDVLQKYPHHASVQVRWQMYGTSNVSKIGPNELLIDQLVYKLPTDETWNQSYKPICRPWCCWFYDSPHRVENIPPWKKETLPVEELRLNHYTMGDEHYFKTVKLPFYLKVIGSAKGITDRLDTNAFNDVKDTVIYRFSPKVQQIIQDASAAPTACREVG